MEFSEIPNADELDSFAESVITKVKVIARKRQKLNSTLDEFNAEEIANQALSSTVIQDEKYVKIKLLPVHFSGCKCKLLILPLVIYLSLSIHDNQWIVGAL